MSGGRICKMWLRVLLVYVICLFMWLFGAPELSIQILFIFCLKIGISVHSRSNKYFQVPFLVLQLVISRGLVSVPGRTNQYLGGPVSTWEDTDWSFRAKDLDISVMVLPGTEWSFQIMR